MIEKISIVIPYHGRLSLFKETLESLRKQSFKDFEVVISDDTNDTENIKMLIDSYSDLHIKYVKSSINLGAISNTLQGINNASNNFIHILHTDDILSPNCIQFEQELINKYPGNLFINHIHHAFENEFYSNEHNEYKIECPKTSWEQCEDCQALIRKENLKDEFELHAYFIQQVEKIAEGLGRKLIGWDEVLEGGLPLKATVMSWRGEAGGIKAAQLGNNVIMTPNTYCYLDYYQENPEFAPLAIGGFISLEQVYDYEPIPEALTAEEAKHIMGIQGNIWGEYVATIEKFEYMAFPRLLAIAEVAWSQLENKNRELFISRLKKEFSFFRKRNVNTCREYFRPRIQGGWDSEKGMYAVTLETICPDVDIRYTLDGSEPTVESDIYKGPVYLTENTCVKAVVTDKDNQILEAPTVKNFLVNKATGCTYTLSTDAWSLDWYPVKPTLFTDGVQGFTPSNYEWAAIASGVEIVIDLKKNTTVSGVRFGTMVAPINSTLPAKSMICYLSKDGKEFRQIGESTFSYPVYKGEKEIYHNYVKTDKKDGRYLKLVINGQTELPEGYPYPNALPSIALDEIEVF